MSAQLIFSADNPSSLRHLLGVDLDQRYENDHDQGEDDNKTEYNQNSVGTKWRLTSNISKEHLSWALF